MYMNISIINAIINAVCIVLCSYNCSYTRHIDNHNYNSHVLSSAIYYIMFRYINYIIIFE